MTPVLLFPLFSGTQVKQRVGFVHSAIKREKSEVVRMVVRKLESKHKMTLSIHRSEEVREKAKNWKREKGKFYKCFLRPVKDIKEETPTTQTVAAGANPTDPPQTVTVGDSTGDDVSTIKTITPDDSDTKLKIALQQLAKVQQVS